MNKRLALTLILVASVTVSELFRLDVLEYGEQCKYRTVHHNSLTGEETVRGYDCHAAIWISQR